MVRLHGGLGVNREVTARRIGFPIAIPTEAFYETYRRLFPILRPLTASTMPAAVAAEEIDDSWYHVMLFGDSWCKDGNTRGYAAHHGDRILESYNPNIHPAPLLG